MKSEITEYITLHGVDAFKRVCYMHTNKFEYACILDSCSLNTGVSSGNYEFLAAFGAKEVVSSYNQFLKLATASHWLFGVLGYDLKNSFESLSSENHSLINQQEVCFFIPEAVLSIDKKGQVEIIFGKEILSELLNNDSATTTNSMSFDQGLDEASYLKKINEIHELIREGEVYELNYCQAFEHCVTAFNPVQFHLDLIKKSPVPMASFLKFENMYMCGASMERFLAKNGNQLVSQPIKGTIKKGADFTEDSRLIAQLENSEKDRAENVMIVDLVRNDLAKVCTSGSIKVDELFGIYSYLQVHQMISTVSGQLKDGQSIDDILRATFPMGSMTGAPKISAMQHIDRLEDFKRGWYSGAAGYISPKFNFDFNVVIRSLFFDSDTNKIVYCAGGAITIDSDPHNEWDELQLKTKAITDVLRA